MRRIVNDNKKSHNYNQRIPSGYLMSRAGQGLEERRAHSKMSSLPIFKDVRYFESYHLSPFDEIVY